MTENLCFKCPVQGLCCYNSVLVADEDGVFHNIALKNHPCKYLDTDDNLCLIYDARFKLNPYCISSLEESARQGGLPDECSYLKEINLKNYKKIPNKTFEIPKNISENGMKTILYLEGLPRDEFIIRFKPLLV